MTLVQIQFYSALGHFIESAVIVMASSVFVVLHLAYRPSSTSFSLLAVGNTSLNTIIKLILPIIGIRGVTMIITYVPEVPMYLPLLLSWWIEQIVSEASGTTNNRGVSVYVFISRRATISLVWPVRRAVTPAPTSP